VDDGPGGGKEKKELDFHGTERRKTRPNAPRLFSKKRPSLGEGERNAVEVLKKGGKKKKRR